MTSGPPSSEAGPSTPRTSDPATGSVASNDTTNPNSLNYAQQSTFALSPSSSTPQYYPYSNQWYSGNNAPGPAYYTYPVHNWTPSQWNSTGQAHVAVSTLPTGTTTGPTRFSITQSDAKARRPSPPPSRKHWDIAIRDFLMSAGLTQALRGLECDMLVMNTDRERKQIPHALEKLQADLQVETIPYHNSCRRTQYSSQNVDSEEVNISDTSANDEDLAQRKLDYVHFVPGVEPRTPTSTTKDISRFLAKNRARNDASNRAEFLLSQAEKRRKLDEDGNSAPVSSCARTDAKTQNRNIQMKYDIAKNEDGPLRRTVKQSPLQNVPADMKRENGMVDQAELHTAERYPALDERLTNIEKHVAVRYVPSPPRSLLDRLKFLEDHLIQLEKEYPPWAALHFNQPHRGWPPPPRPTPIIVPSHLTSSDTVIGARDLIPPTAVPQTPEVPTTVDGNEGGAQKGKGKGSGIRAKSSLHRAVMERLEVQKALQDFAGKGTNDPAQPPA
ncbi:hypothetical protein K474DRAFT_1452215 [Panus rudis PR-1116 ss-1]|nr:hypothetical protein K474DRAFT_1452215 [Panus rudis PR-1116 ss-1]